jgi:probable rRNA maturation factor
MNADAITLVVTDAGWRKAQLAARLKRAAVAAVEAGGFKNKNALTLLLADDETLRRLNCDFRGQDKPTNVLAFPAAADVPAYCGDIAIAWGVTHREAAASGKRLADHACHLAVHGVLHLAGYDHGRAADAWIMETLETRILGRLGIADPYGVLPHER